MWNTNREGGWENFKTLTTDNKILDEVANDETDNPDILMNKIDKELTKVKFAAFGKVKVRENPKISKELVKLQKEKISQQQREFTNKELLEIVNNTEEGRAILEREKLRIQAEMEKVESMESIPELQQIGMRVISFLNLKKPQDMKQVMLTLSIADSEGKILESQDCCVIETLLEDGVYKTSCPETFFALKRKDIPRKSAFILEL